MGYQSYRLFLCSFTFMDFLKLVGTFYMQTYVKCESVFYNYSEKFKTSSSSRRHINKSSISLPFLLSQVIHFQAF